MEKLFNEDCAFCAKIFRDFFAFFAFRSLAKNAKILANFASMFHEKMRNFREIENEKNISRGGGMFCNIQDILSY